MTDPFSVNLSRFCQSKSMALPLQIMNSYLSSSLLQGFVSHSVKHKKVKVRTRSNFITLTIAIENFIKLSYPWS